MTRFFPLMFISCHCSVIYISHYSSSNKFNKEIPGDTCFGSPFSPKGLNGAFFTDIEIASGGGFKNIKIKETANV